MRMSEPGMSHYLDRLTWPEIRGYLMSTTELILPIGICEQHSLHLPLRTDTVVCEHVAGFLSRRTGILIAPTVQYGVGLPCDRFLPGTTSISKEILHGMVGDLLNIWLNQGFRTIYIVTAHGDPHHVEALRYLETESVAFRELWDIPLDDILEKQHCARHAGEAETSVMLFLDPDSVRNEQIVNFHMTFEEFEPYLMHQRHDPIPESPGGLGFPGYANHGKGERILHRMKEYALSWLQNHRERNTVLPAYDNESDN